MTTPLRRSSRITAREAIMQRQTTFITSRKRSHDEAQLQQQSRQPRAKTSRNKRLKHFPLMQLPTEIRLQILRRLLWQQETLRKNSFVLQHDDDCGVVPFKKEQTFSLCPAILRVCRQLHREGEPILYDNTFGCDMWYDEEVIYGDMYSSALLKHGWDILQRTPERRTSYDTRTHVPFRLTDRIRKLELSIYVSDPATLLEVRTGVRNFVKGSRCLSQLAHLNVHLKFDVPNMDENSAESAVFYWPDVAVSKQQFLHLSIGPLALMRCLKSVSINGVSEDIATKLTSTVTQRAYVDDLPRMIDVLRQHVHKSVEVRHCRPCNQTYAYLRLAEQAVDINDLLMFKHLRGEILDLIDDHQAHERKIVYRHDPLSNEASQGGFDEYGKPIPEDTIRFLEEDSDSDEDDWGEEPEYEDLETEPIRKAREAREKQDPVLKMLREIWYWEESDDW